MGKENLETLIEKKREKFKNKKLVAFLGEVKSGKTVIAAIFYYHLLKHWIPDSKGAWQQAPVMGDEDFLQIIRRMKEGHFTSPTLKNDYPNLIVEVYSMQGVPVTKKLNLHDMSGETYVELLSQQYTSEDNRLKQILSTNGDYIPFAKHYVIVIDCGDFGNWDTDIGKVGRMIRPLKLMKQKIHKLDENALINDQVSIVFAKADLLDEKYKNYTPEQLLKEYPTLYSTLVANVEENKICCFKVLVDSIKEKPEEVEERLKKNEDNKEDISEQKIKMNEQQIHNAIELAIEDAKIKAMEQKLDHEETQKMIEDARKKVIDENKPSIKIEQKSQNIEDSKKPSTKVKMPFTYSESEYSKLISWIILSKRD